MHTGWYLLTGHRFRDTAGRPFFDFVSASSRELALRLQLSMTRGKRYVCTLTLRPADPDETEFIAVVCVTPMYAASQADQSNAQPTHVSLRALKLVSPEYRKLPRGISSAQRRQLRVLLACRPASTYEHAVRQEERAGDETGSAQSLTSGSYTESIGDEEDPGTPVVQNSFLPTVASSGSVDSIAQ